MNRGVITISESGKVSMQKDTVWMTMQENDEMHTELDRHVALICSVSLQRMQWHRPAIKQRSLEALRLQPLGRATAVF